MVIYQMTGSTGIFPYIRRLTSFFPFRSEISLKLTMGDQIHHVHKRLQSPRPPVVVISVIKEIIVKWIQTFGTLNK